MLPEQKRGSRVLPFAPFHARSRDPPAGRLRNDNADLAPQVSASIFSLSPKAVSAACFRRPIQDFYLSALEAIWEQCHLGILPFH